MDQGQLDALYQQYLGRGVDPSGASTWGGADYNTVVQGILGSQEYQNRQQQSQPQQQAAPQQSGGGGTDINSIYQQYLGRGVDPSGAATYAGWDPQSIINAVTSSQEYAQRQGSANGVSPTAPSGGNPNDLASQVFSAYKTNQNYDEALNQLNATPQNADYYRARLGLLGNMMGWQTGQNTGDRNTVYEQELASYLPGARAAGLSDAEINSLINKNAATSNQENQQRIAQEAAQGQGWVNQNIPGGWTTVGALAAAVAAPYALSALGAGAGAGAGGALTTTELMGGAGGAFVPSAGSGASFLISPGAAYTAAGLGSSGIAEGLTAGYDLANLVQSYPGISPEQLASIMEINYGADPLLALDAGRLASQGLSASAIDQILGYSYPAAELAGTGITSFLPEAASVASALSSGMTASQLANMAKTGLGLAGTASKILGGTSGTSPSSQLSKALGSYNPTTAATGMQSSDNFGLVKGNVNPFLFAKEVPTQTLATSKADPFAALNVAQTPIQPFNPLAHLVG